MRKKNTPWNAIVIFLSSLLVYLALPYHLPILFVKNIYFTGLVVLAIFLIELLTALWLITLLRTKPLFGIEPAYRKPLNLLSVVRLTFTAFLYFATFLFYSTYLEYTTLNAVQNKTWIVIGVLLFLTTILTIFNIIRKLIRDMQTQVKADVTD